MRKLLAFSTALMLSAQVSAWAGVEGNEMVPFGLQNLQNLKSTPATPPIPKKDMTLEMILPRADLPIAFVQPVPLAGTKIAGLTPKALQLLGFNYFVVVGNTGYTDMAELYRENRLNGKSNFVTADSIIHPYFAFTNRVLVDVVTKHLLPDLRELLKAMLEVSLTDYKKADDSAVRNDIGHNLAFLSVGVKLVDPAFEPPAVGNVPALVTTELANIQKGVVAQSAILEASDDFAAYQPIGWYNSTPDLQNFYRAREWVSRAAFPLSDIDFDTRGKQGNNFRRSVLLYRSLELSTVNGRAAYELWNRLYRCWSLLGSPVAALQDKTLLPPEYKSVFKVAPKDLKVTLSSLAEPLFRTKLMLSVRKRKPLQLGSISIWDIGDAAHSNEQTTSFRLFPLSGCPELPWLRAASRNYKEETTDSSSWPIGLLLLHAWGAPQATNILNDNVYKLDPRLAQAIPDLQRSILQRVPGGLLKPVEDRRWQILSAYFSMLPETTPAEFRTEMWMSRKLESAIAGWVDSHVGLSPSAAVQAAPAAKPAEEESAAKPATFHYVEPNPEIFKKIQEDAMQLSNELINFGYMTDEYRKRFEDFMRLSQRLQIIAEQEAKGEAITVADMKLLGNIDMILEKVVVPLAGTLSFGSGQTGATKSGVTLGLGRPGLLYIILRQGQTRTVLARGAVYTYYEVAGGPIKPQHWERKLEYELVKPPSWTDKFDIIQPAARRAPVSASSEGR